jgi:uncharacterized Zn finger protein
MQCVRCAGMTVPEIIGDGGLRALALRCIHCGDVVDRVIARNRLRRRRAQPSRSRTSVFGEDLLKGTGRLSPSPHHS